MHLSMTISQEGRTLVSLAIETAFDASSVEAANHMRFALLDATSWDDHDPRFDQFLIGTAVHDWAAATFRSGRDADAVIHCSEGRPLRGAMRPDLVVRAPDPAEPVVTLLARSTKDGIRHLRTERVDC